MSPRLLGTRGTCVEGRGRCPTPPAYSHRPLTVHSCACRYGSERSLDQWVPWLLAPWDEEALPDMKVVDARAAELVDQCALRGGVPADDVLHALAKLEARRVGATVDAALFGSTEGGAAAWELVFASAVVELPVVGPLLGGYLPNRETLCWDLSAGRLELEIELLPFLPRVRVNGEELTWDGAAQTLTYRVEERPPSVWTVFYANQKAGVLAARSSVTGLNVIRRV